MAERLGLTKGMGWVKVTPDRTSSSVWINLSYVSFLERSENNKYTYVGMAAGDKKVDAGEIESRYAWVEETPEEILGLT